MANNPTGLLLESEPSWSIFDVMRPITDLPDIDSEGQWVEGAGVTLWYQITNGLRRRMPKAFLMTADDAAAGAIADPTTVWEPAAIGEVAAGQLYNYPTGVRTEQSPELTATFRPFQAEVPTQVMELWSRTLPSAQEQADSILRAHVARQLNNELVDSLYTKNPGLSLSASDQSGAAAVSPGVALATLYGADAAANGNGHCVLHMPVHALPYFHRQGLVGWVNGQLRDIYGNLVNLLTELQGPLTDLTDLTTGTAPAAGEGWVWLSSPIYGAISNSPIKFPDEISARGGYDFKANEQVGAASVPAIVAFEPSRTFVVKTVLNLPIGA